MNNQATIEAMRKLSLWGMAQCFEQLIRLPLDQHPTADHLVAQLIQAEQAYRQHRKTVVAVRQARFRYQAAVEEIDYLAGRNLDNSTLTEATAVLMNAIAELLGELRGEKPPRARWDPAQRGQQETGRFEERS